MSATERSEADWDRIAGEHRVRQLAATIQCPHCGTKGEWSYGGLSPAWLGNGNAKLAEFTKDLRWDGTFELGQDHTPARCMAVLVARRDELLAAMDEVFKAGIAP